jgi:hypothetical protein
VSRTQFSCRHGLIGPIACPRLSREGIWFENDRPNRFGDARMPPLAASTIAIAGGTAEPAGSPTYVNEFLASSDGSATLE